MKIGVQESQYKNIIENAEQISRISLEELKSIMGEPVLSESWVNTTSKGNFDTVIYGFDKNSNHYEFIVANDTVAKMRIYSSKCWTNTGDYFTIESSKKNIYKSFGITLDKNYTTKDTGATYTMESLNNKIARMRVHGIENNTYQLIDFFYDMQYFD